MFSALKKLLGIRETKKCFEAQLFSGSAYFSNRVPSAFLQKWVQHGGQLSSGSASDVRARYFFATDPLEPWATKLFAKSIMVIHAGWIAHCVDAAFQVPIAEYILDDKFIPGYPYKLTDYFSPPIYVPLSDPEPADIETDEFRPMSIQTSDTPSTPTSMPHKRKREQAYFDSPSGSLVFSGFDKDGVPRRPRKQRKLRFDPSFSPGGGKSGGEMMRTAGLDRLQDYSALGDDVEINEGHGQDRETGTLRGPDFMTTSWSPTTPEKPLTQERLSATYRRLSIPEQFSKPTHVSSPGVSVDKREKMPPVRTIDFTNLPPSARRWRFPDAGGKKPGDKDTILSFVKSTDPKVKTPKKISFAERARVRVYDASPRSDTKDAIGAAPARQCEGIEGGPEVDDKTRVLTDEVKVKVPDGLTAEATDVLASCTEPPKIDDGPAVLLDGDQFDGTLTMTMEEVRTRRRYLHESVARNGIDDGQLLTFFEPQKSFQGMAFRVMW